MSHITKIKRLATARRYSASWVYERLAKQLGHLKSQYYLDKLDYGNASIDYERHDKLAIKPNNELGAYWVDGKLAITAFEQVQMLQKLYNNELPFSIEHQELVKDIMLVQAEDSWQLRAKTGWQGKHGWWIGLGRVVIWSCIFRVKYRYPK